MSIPAPSPVFFSAPHAPRCSRFKRIWTPSRTILLDLRPLRSTTKPTPHESCSYWGSYRPCLGGKPVCVMSHLLPGPPGGAISAAVGRRLRRRVHAVAASALARAVQPGPDLGLAQLLDETPGGHTQGLP